MTLQDALDASKADHVMRRLDGETFAPVWEPAAIRPYYSGSLLYHYDIVAFSDTKFFVVNKTAKAKDLAVPLKPEDSWQVLGKDDWEPRLK